MKKAITMILTLWLAASAQAADWTNFSNFASITAVHENGSKLWIAGRGGVVVIDTATLKRTYYKKTAGQLPSLMIEDMACAVNGTTWIGTYDLGLVRVSGGQFTNFPFADPATRLYHIAVDQAGTVWCATTEGLYKNVNGTFTAINTPTGLVGGWDVEVLPGGKILLASNQPVIYDPITNTSYTQSSPVFAYSNSIVEVKDSNAYYFATDHGGIISVQDTTVTDISDSTVADGFSIQITQLKRLADGTLIALRSDSKTFAYDGQHWSSYVHGPAVEGAEATFLFQKRSGEIFAAGKNLGGEIRSLTGHTDFSLQRFGIWSNIINTVKTKSDHELWIMGGTQVGVYDLHTASFSRIDELPGIMPSTSGGITEWDGATIAFGYNGLYRWSGTVWQQLTVQGLPASGIMSAAADTSGNLYIGTGNGLYVLNGTNVTHYTATNTPVLNNNDMVRDLHFEAKTNTVWLATVYGIVKYKAGAFSIINGSNTPSIQGYSYIQTISEAPDGKLWFGTAYGGLISYDGSDYTLQVLPNTAGNQTVNGIAFDGQTMYVVDNVHSFWVNESGTWTNYNMINSDLNSTYLTGATVDANHNVWITAWDNGSMNAFGVDVFNKNAVALFIKDVATTTITVYPNPATSQLTVQDPSLSDGALVTLTDQLGRSYPFTLRAQHIDISALAAGVYILDAHTATAPVRIVKQ